MQMIVLIRLKFLMCSFAQYPGKTKLDKEYQEVPAMVRVELWVGLREYQHKWTERNPEKGEGKFEIYAETVSKTVNEAWSNSRFIRIEKVSKKFSSEDKFHL